MGSLLTNLVTGTVQAIVHHSGKNGLYKEINRQQMLQSDKLNQILIVTLGVLCVIDSVDCW